MTNNLFIGEPYGPLVPRDGYPPFGYKVVMIQWNNGAPLLVPPHYHHNETKFVDESKCFREHKDAKSFQRCHCGFYAYHSVEKAVAHLGNFDYAANCFLAQVAFSGTIIDAEYGMKASHQRVRQLAIPPCWNCKAESSQLVKHKSGYLVGACDFCVAKYALTPIGFSELQRLTKADNFNPISLVPVKNYEKRYWKELFDYADAKSKIREGLTELLESGSLASLIEVKFELDELIAKASEND